MVQHSLVSLLRTKTNRKEQTIAQRSLVVIFNYIAVPILGFSVAGTVKTDNGELIPPSASG